MIHRLALGQSVPLGTLYDAQTDTFLDQSILRGRIPDQCGAVSVSPSPKTEIQATTVSEYQQKFNLLQFSPDLVASYFAGYITPRGSASYLRSSSGPPPGIVSAALLHEYSVCTERLNISCMTEETLDIDVLRGTEATHIVVSVDKGANSLVELRSSIIGDAKVPSGSEVLAEAERLKASLDPASENIGTPHDKSNQLSPALPLDIQIFSDTMEGPISTQDLSEAQQFLAMLPIQIRQLYGGIGTPIRYELVPLGVLVHMNHILKDVPSSEVNPISQEYVERLASALDASQVSCQSLAAYCACISRHRGLVPEMHLQQVEEGLTQATVLSSSFASQLALDIKDVRSKKRPASDLDRKLQEFVDDASNSKKLVIQWADIRTKAQFAADVTSKGGTYVGYNGISLPLVLSKKDGRDTFVMSYSTKTMADQIAWDKNKALLFSLLKTKSDRITIVVVDRDGAEGDHSCHEKVHIALYKNGAQTIDDVLEQREFMADKCLVQYNPSTLESSDVQRPLKRRPVKILCPSDKCGTTARSWICRICTSLVEFGYTDKFIYCDCGRSGYENYKFKCCSPSHGPAYVRYQNDRLLSLLQTLGPGDCLNILILGETGVGKSTFINAFVNYLEYKSLDEAKNSDLNVLIPCTFSNQVMDHENGNIIDYRVKVGDDLNRSDERDGSRGGSATQKTMVYPVTMGGRTIRLIDTPGIGDTRGLEYDKRNMTDILNTLSSYDYLHGILILVKSNDSRLSVTFEFCMKQLLTHLHRSAVDNIAFGFTHSRISNYSLGDTFGPLKAILGGQTDVNIRLTAQNVYSFDSESFRYLAAIKSGVHLSHEEDFRRSWEKSSEEVVRMISHFERKKPHPVISTISITGTRRLINELTKPMAEISAMIRTNIALLTDQLHDIQNDRVSIENLRRRLNIETVLLRTKDLDRPRTVCSDKACRTFKKDGSGTGALQTVYTQVCHKNCKRPNVALENIADPGLVKCRAFGGGDSCKVCSHKWEQHLHIMYELEPYKTTVKDEGIEAQIRQHVSDLALKQETIDQLMKRIDEYKNEHDKISRAAAQFCFFLQQNSLTAINDKTLEYIDYLINEEEAKEQQGGGRQKLDGLYQDRAKHIQLVEVMERDMKLGVRGGGVAALDREGVDRVVKGLYGLKHFGGSLEALKNGIAAAHQATYREVPFRVGRRRRPATASPRHPARPQVQARRASFITSVLSGSGRRPRRSHTHSS